MQEFPCDKAFETYFPKCNEKLAFEYQYGRMSTW